jgi:hypothetical protein
LYQLFGSYLPTHQLHQSSLFVSLLLPHAQAIALYMGLARRVILVRYCPLKNSPQALLRFGLPAADNVEQHQRFVAALNALAGRVSLT